MLGLLESLNDAARARAQRAKDDRSLPTDRKITRLRQDLVRTEEMLRTALVTPVRHRHPF